MSELYDRMRIEVAQRGAGAKLRMVPDNALVVAGQIFTLHAEIGTAEAAQVLGCHQITVAKMCESGKLREGADWRRLSAGRGPYLIRREAILEMRRNGNGGC